MTHRFLVLALICLSVACGASSPERETSSAQAQTGWSVPHADECTTALHRAEACDLVIRLPFNAVLYPRVASIAGRIWGVNAAVDSVGDWLPFRTQVGTSNGQSFLRFDTREFRWSLERLCADATPPFRGACTATFLYEEANWDVSKEALARLIVTASRDGSGRVDYHVTTFDGGPARRASNFFGPNQPYWNYRPEVFLVPFWAVTPSARRVGYFARDGYANWIQPALTGTPLGSLGPFVVGD
jgi:hypothetical protein